jgi:FkbM family methyltransferase
MGLRRQAKYWWYTSVPGVAGRVPYYGTTVHFPPRAPVFRVMCENGRFEPDIIDRLVELTRPDTTVFDVGANLGLMAIPVLHGCQSCRVVSFEPSPNSLAFLRKTVAGSGYGARWHVVEKALAARPGQLDFAIGRPEDALFEGLKSGDRIANARTIVVPVSTLDDEWIALGSPAVSVVKIDVEGAEGQVLEGARALLAAEQPVLLIEWYTPYLQRFGTPPIALLAAAASYRYRIFSVPLGIPVTDAVALRAQMLSCQNFLLLPEDRV